MAIFQHESVRDVTLYANAIDRTTCLYCASALVRDEEDVAAAVIFEDLNYGMSDNFSTRSKANIGICAVCGWWLYSVLTWIGGRSPPSQQLKAGALKQLDLTDVRLPIADVRAYLAAKYGARLDIDPRLFEDVVASVFRDHGFSAVVTAYSGDGGIDVILEDGEGTIGVQVKRYKGRIAVDQIRELAGSLLINGHMRGIFVTTSTFQGGARKTADASAARGYPIELVDAPAFYEALKIAQINSTDDIRARKPWGAISVF